MNFDFYIDKVNYNEISTEKFRQDLIKGGQSNIIKAKDILEKPKNIDINFDELLPTELFEREKRYHIGVNKINRNEIETKKDFYLFLSEGIQTNPTKLSLGRGLVSIRTKNVYFCKSDFYIHQDLVIFMCLKERIKITSDLLNGWIDTYDTINKFFCFETLPEYDDKKIILMQSESYDLVFNKADILTRYKFLLDKYKIDFISGENNKYGTEE